MGETAIGLYTDPETGKLKHCPLCNQDKPVEEFHKASGSPGRRQSHCKPCRCLRVRAQRHGMAVEDLLRWLDEQKGHCATCSKEASVIDHDHETGRIRGLLCQGCNLALGHAKDNPLILENLARYLRGDHG